MRRPLGCAIDFGTTNSSVALVYQDEVRLVDLGQQENRHAVRSVLYLHRNGQQLVGERAIAQFTTTARDHSDEDYDARLLIGLKYLLTDPGMHTKSWGRTFDVPCLIAMVLSYLKERAESEAGAGPIQRVMLGHPVEFARIGGLEHRHPHIRAGDDLTATAMATLRNAAKLAGFQKITLLAEPEGALATLNPARDSDTAALTLDIGGGTCDLALDVPRSGGRKRGKRDRRHLRGLPIGGDRFDRTIFREKLEGPLGLHSESRTGSGQPLPFPAHWRSTLGSSARVLNVIGHRRSMTDLAGLVAQWRHDGLTTLYRIIEAGLSAQFFRAVEAAKIELSAEDWSVIEFRRPAYQIHVSEEVERYEFEDAIGPDLDAVADATLGILRDASVAASDIGIVLPTGGSSSIPGLRERLVAIFGRDRIVGGSTLLSVVEGLGIEAQRKWSPL